MFVLPHIIGSDHFCSLPLLLCDHLPVLVHNYVSSSDGSSVVIMAYSPHTFPPGFSKSEENIIRTWIVLFEYIWTLENYPHKATVVSNKCDTSYCVVALSFETMVLGQSFEPCRTF